jgi:secretion/DNA translocation related TadE-like protein
VRQRPRGERGVASSFGLLVAAVLVVAVVGAVAGVRVLVAQREAAAAADLGALAGAVAIQRGSDGCRAAERLVGRTDARVRSCEARGEHLRLVVGVDLGTLAGRRVSVAARGRAGPR